MKTIKRSLAGCLAFLLAALSTVSFALIPAPRAEALELSEIPDFVGCCLGVFLASFGALTSGSYKQLMANKADFSADINALMADGHISYDDSTQKVVIDETAQNTMREKAQSEMANVEGWWWLRGNMHSRDLCAGYANEQGLGPAFLSNADKLVVYMSYSSSRAIPYQYTGTTVCDVEGYLVGNNVTNNNFYQIQALNEKCEVLSLVQYSSLHNALRGLSGIAGIQNGTVTFFQAAKEDVRIEDCRSCSFYIGQVPRRVFTSTSSLKLILSSGDISLIDTDPATEPVSISPDTLTKTDWQEVNEKQHNEIMEELGDIKGYLSGAITQKEMNKLIKNQTKKLNNAIENSTGDIIDAIETEKNILEKILKQMKTLNANVSDGFSNIAELIGNQGGTSVSFSSEDIVAAITQLQEALLSDNQEFNEQTSQLIAKCQELLEAVGEGNEYVSADLDVIKELMQNIVDNTSDPDSTINFKTKEIRDFLELMQIDVGKLSETVCKLDVDVLNDLLTKMLTGTDKQSELLEDILKETKKSNALLTASLLVDLFQTVLNGEDDGSLIDDLTMTFQPVAQTASEKFPFSLPKDLYEIVQTLDAEPVAPKFTLPLKFSIGSRSFDNEIDIDLSRFDPLAEICRNGLKLLFLIGLVWLSWHSTGGGGGSGEGGDV